MVMYFDTKQNIECLVWEAKFRS